LQMMLAGVASCAVASASTGSATAPAITAAPTTMPTNHARVRRSVPTIAATVPPRSHGLAHDGVTSRSIPFHEPSSVGGSIPRQATLPDLVVVSA
jgi:hypothetical protein